MKSTRRSVLMMLMFTAVRAVLCSYDVSDKVIFPNLPNAAPRSENKVCREESQMYIEHLNNMTLWAHRMWDATAKSTTGILQGSIFHFGNFDECMKVFGPFRTQFCFATITATIPDEHKPKDPKSLKFHPYENILKRIYKTDDISQQNRYMANVGWCVPASCTWLDLEKSLNQYLMKMDHPFNEHNVTYQANIMKNTCQRDNELEIIDSADIAFCFLTAILILLVIIGTVYDIRTEEEFAENEKQPKRSLGYKLIVAFSAKKTYAELPRADDSNPKLKILNGMRTFAILMIIMDHRFGTYISGPMENFDYIEKEYRSVSAWFLFHGDLFVDTFFILSGLLVAYGLLNQFDKKFVHPGFIIIVRYVRLTPLYAFVIFFWSTMLSHIGSGPFWPLVVPPEVADCRKNWWTNLLYLSNYIDGNHMCMTHSWYLPCDLHYFILAIFIIIAVKKNKIYGFTLLTALFLLSIAIPFAITVVYLRPALMNFYPVTLAAPKANDDWTLSYSTSHTRASTYFIGMYAGYILYKLRDTEYTISKTKSHILTAVSIILLFAGMSPGGIFYNPYHEYNVAEAGAYAALHRPIWGLGTVGLIFAATHGRATFLNEVLSYKFWTPLSKLVYGAYLTHMLFQLRGVGVAVNPRHFTYFDAVSMAIGDWVMSFALSLALYVMIENPFRKIIKYLLMPSSETRRRDTMDDNSGVATRDTSVTDSRL